MDDMFVVILAVVTFVPIGIFFGVLAASCSMKSQAIEHGYAQYCLANGAWAWKGECRE